jgi:hypothetical protein
MEGCHLAATSARRRSASPSVAAPAPNDDAPGWHPDGGARDRGGGLPRGCGKWCRQLTVLDPLNGSAALGVMRTLAAARDVSWRTGSPSSLARDNQEEIGDGGVSVRPYGRPAFHASGFDEPHLEHVRHRNGTQNGLIAGRRAVDRHHRSLAAANKKARPQHPQSFHEGVTRSVAR